GEDKVGQVNQTTPNGKPDFHISVSGLRGIPNKVTITNDNNGIWETPFNGTNWIIATQYDGSGNGELWFEQYSSNKFHVKVRYSDGTTDEADATNQNTTPLSFASLSPVNLTFGNQIIGTSTALQQVSLSNSGNAPLSISGITITADSSQPSTCTSTLTAGPQCSVSVKFQPLVIGPR